MDQLGDMKKTAGEKVQPVKPRKKCQKSLNKMMAVCAARNMDKKIWYN